MKKNLLIFILSITLFAFSIIGCNETNTNNLEANTNVSTNEEDKFNDVNEIAKSNLPVEEQYNEALKLIDMETYLTKDYDNIIPITPVEALQKMKNGENFIIYHGRSECRYCKYVYPSIAETLPQDLNVYYVNTDYFRFLYPTDENSELFKYVKNMHDEYKTTFNFSGVPNIKYVKDYEVTLSLSNPLSAEFFDETATKETKEENLESMKATLSYYLNYMYEDMYGKKITPTQSVTISK